MFFLLFAEREITSEGELLLSLGITLEGGQKGDQEVGWNEWLHNIQGIYSPTDTVLKTTGQLVGGGVGGEKGAGFNGYWTLCQTLC